MQKLNYLTPHTSEHGQVSGVDRNNDSGQGTEELKDMCFLL